MSKEQREKLKRDAENSPLLWLIELEIARGENDFERVVRAQRRLRNLGVVVQYLPNKPQAAMGALVG